MFSLLSGLIEYLFTKPRLNILLIGLDYAGKTTLLENLKTSYGKVPGIPPDKIPATIGMNLARLSYHGTQVIIWDLGGQLKMRSLWEKYYDEAHAIIFLVDATDVNRLEEARLAYEAVCDNDQLSTTPVLLFANKMDVVSALHPGEIATTLFAMQDSSQRRKIFPISALTGEGLDLAIVGLMETAKHSASQRSHR
jgi:ADP-ribosylation factor related protein 1